jgi:tetratricopeptide (TPR) repeat protein
VVGDEAENEKVGGEPSPRSHSIDQDPFEAQPTVDDLARDIIRRAEDLLRLSTEAQERGDLHYALEACNKAVEIAPEYLLARMRRGIVHLLGANPTQALHDFEAAIQFAPNDARPYNSCGLCYQQLGQDERAITYFTRAIELSPNANSYNCRGWSQRRLGNFAEADADFQAAVALSQKK